MPLPPDYKLQRRVAGGHNLRLDGIGDLLSRARGMSVMDIGCNRGMVGYEFAQNGATTVHGCDNYEPGIFAAQDWFVTAREVFVDMRAVSHRFEVVDLTGGMDAFKAAFPVEPPNEKYDIVVMLATYHKLKRVMTADRLSQLVQHLGDRTGRWFAWRGTSDKPEENEDEIYKLDGNLKYAGLKRIHTSYLSDDLGVAAIWGR